MSVILFLWYINLAFQLRFVKWKYYILEILKQGALVILLVKASQFLEISANLAVAYALSFTLIIALSRYALSPDKQNAWIGYFSNLLHLLGLVIIWYKFGFLYLIKIVVLFLIFSFFLSVTFVRLILFPEKLEMKKEDHNKSMESLLNFCGFMPKIFSVYIMWYLFFS